jgi:uncharacterized protein YgiM (DUF1202 family)
MVAFLLVASFGLLFVTGCSSTVRGPDAEERDDTFTLEDAERMQNAQSVMGGQVSSAVTSAMPTMPIVQGGSGATVAAASADPDLVRRYEQLRMGLSSNQAGNTYRVVNEFLNVRSTPNVSGAFVARLNQGDMVSVAEFINAGWAKVTLAGGSQGYVSSRYIAKIVSEDRLKDEQKAFEGVYFVNFGFVNVRKSPDSGSDKMGEIPGQAFVRPLSIEKEWARVPFEGKEGYVSMQFLSPFQPSFLVRQDQYQAAILHYDALQQGAIETIGQHVAVLKKANVQLLTFADLQAIVQTQEVRDVRLPPKAAIIAISGVTAQNARAVSDAVTGAGGKASLFIQTDQLGLSGITEKLMLTLQANGMDIQSGSHSGDDLRTLTQPQTQLELLQSRSLLENLTRRSVSVILYPQGGVNERVIEEARRAGYLFGIGSAPDGTFSREQFLRLPSYTVGGGMTGEDALKLVK